DTGDDPGPGNRVCRPRVLSLSFMTARPFASLGAFVSLVAAVLGAALMLTTSARGATPTPAEIARGKYVFGATGGCGCHTEPGKPPKPPNSGGRKYEGPFGTVYATNITPDSKTGIGGWTDEQIITAIRLGRR